MCCFVFKASVHLIGNGASSGCDMDEAEICPWCWMKKRLGQIDEDILGEGILLPEGSVGCRKVELSFWFDFISCHVWAFMVSWTEQRVVTVLFTCGCLWVSEQDAARDLTPHPSLGISASAKSVKCKCESLCEDSEEGIKIGNAGS